ncbi:hypothetical protein KR018_010240, partial [Drosophila ironensis]
PPQLDELDSERINELESILYASVHYRDDAGAPPAPPAAEAPTSEAATHAADAQSMPPPLQPQGPSPAKHAQRIVQGTRVINNPKARPRYWAEAGEGSQQRADSSRAAKPSPEPGEWWEERRERWEDQGPLLCASNRNRPGFGCWASAPPSQKPSGKRPPMNAAKEAAKSSNQQSPKSQQQKPNPSQQPKHQNNQKTKQQQAKQSLEPNPKAGETTKANYEAYEPERFDQRLLVAIPPNCSVKKQNKQQQQQSKQQQNKQQQNKQQQNKQQQSKQPPESGPFGKANRKLEQMQKLATKRQKSKQAQLNKKQRKQQGEAVEFVDLAESNNEDSSDDDVVHVPLPPAPIIELDTSDGEPDSSPAELFLEENAMDAADVQMTSQTEEQGMEQEATSDTIPPSLHSPNSSIMSGDEFIVQKDKKRLLADNEKANDDDLLMLTQNAIRDANRPEVLPAQGDLGAENQEDGTEHEFLAPSLVSVIGQSYRVDDQQFRALDVYESESDLNESGIYSKVKPKTSSTVIRSVDTHSDGTSLEELEEPCVQRTKRLRKRTLSTNNNIQSEGDNEIQSNDSDSQDGTQSTGVPGIARGMAVERCKRKIRRISVRRSSQENQKKTARKASEGHEASSESASEDEVPSAREIAEKLLKQEEEKNKKRARAQNSSNNGDNLDAISIGSDVGSQAEAEFCQAMEDNMAVFERIDAQGRASQDLDDEEASGYLSSNEDDSPEQTADTTMISEMAMEVDTSHELKEVEAEPNEEAEQAKPNEEPEQAEPNEEAEQAEPNEEEEQAEEEPILVEHTLQQLTDDSLPRGGSLLGWNEEMRRFYNDSWNGENFSVFKVQRGMSALRQNWRINNADRYPVAKPRSHAKCTNCMEMGHVRSKCPRPKKPLICFICGAVGHAEPRCPNAICFGCGSKQAIYVEQCNKCTFHSRLVCQLCKMRGHAADQCPDKWRRYHSTTQSNVELNSKVQYKNKQCSYCAGRGHLFENCRQRIGDYRNTNYTSQIVSHQKVYKDRSGPLGILGDLDGFFDIETPFHFQWRSKSIPKDSYYAKFLLNVNLAQKEPAKKQSLKALPPIPDKVFTNDYVPNPLAKAALQTAKKTPVGTEKPPVEEAAQDEQTTGASVAAEQISPVQREEITTSFENEPHEATIANLPVGPPEIDSDSNYSFSEHFEVPSSTTNEEKQPPSAAAQKQLPPGHAMAVLPDVIPLSNTPDEDFVMPSTSHKGISMCVNASLTGGGNRGSGMEEAEPSVELPDVPCEGKIIMSRDQSEYLFSPEGRTFLATTAKQCQVSVRMDFKDYGYVLVIYGLKRHQEDLQLKLLRRHQEVRRKTIEFQNQKPPKRVEILIRFMRDGINSLNSNLGNASNHYDRIKKLEDMNTKNGFKIAEKKRRQLNMILVGQAGLLNGNTHLDQLLVLLRKLVDEHSPDDNATPELRNEIEDHWRMIFTSYAHPNYDSLLHSYGRLDQKNRVPSLNIDPVLLGLQQTGKKPNPTSPGKRARSPTPPPPPPMSLNNMDPPPPPKLSRKKQRLAMQQQQQNQQQQLSQQQKYSQQQQQHLQKNLQQIQHQQQQQQKNQQRLQQQQQQQRLQQQQRAQQQQRPQTRQQQQQQRSHEHTMPVDNPQQRSRADLQLNRNLDPEYGVLLAGMERNDHHHHNSIHKDVDKPSQFWSREAFKYLDNLRKMTSDPENTERLNRVILRSQRGLLSHNDYRAVIRLHTMLSN